MNTATHVIHRLAVHFLNVVTTTDHRRALVLLLIQELPPTADLSVQSIQNVQVIKHASEKNAKILALVHAASMQIVML